VLAQDEAGAAVPVAIETVEAGDLVWSRDEHTGEEGFKVVVETYVRETDELVQLSYTSGAGCQPADGSTANTLIGTAEHPFWSLTRDAWINMGELRVGERLSLTTGPATVTAVRVEVLSEPVKVYNFQVADWHTYYAAPEADKPFVWVHNANYGNTSDLLAGTKRNASGGVDFANSPHLYKGKPGQKSIVKIEYTGTRSRDFGAANKAAGISTTQKAPKHYTWHHLDDYDPVTNTGTMQLVRTKAHQAAYPHRGGVAQYEQATGVLYDLSDADRAMLRARGVPVPGS